MFWPFITEYYTELNSIVHCVTFVCPQMLVINGHIGSGQHGLWCPLFFAFMPKKTRGHYTRTYEGVTEVLRRAGVEWQQNLQVMMDFEVN